MADLIKPMLRCNGVPILLSAATPPTVSYDEIGMVADRSARGALAPSRRNLVRAVTAKTAPMTWQDAYAVRALVEGLGAAASFDALPFTLNRALNTTATSGSPALGTAQYLSAPASFQATVATSVTWSNAYIAAWLASTLGCTINLWMRCQTAASYTLVTLSKTGGSDAGLSLTRTATNSLTFTYPSIATLTTNLGNDFNWHMVTAVARDTSLSRYPTASLYVDGNPAATGGAAGTAFAYPARDTLVVGPSAASTTLNIDDLVVYPFPLTDAQVLGLYNSQSPYGNNVSPREQQTARYLPQVWLSGDMLGDSMLAVGRVVGSQILAVHRDPITGELLTNGMTQDLQFYEAGAPR